jgi:hypothetical protein
MQFRMMAMSMADWLELGIKSGFCTEVVCETHDGATMTSEERDEFEDGGDPCVPVVRLWHEGEAPAAPEK